MKSETFEKYQNEIANLSLIPGNDPASLQKIFSIIEQFKAETPEEVAFFSAEQAFYGERYEKSLQQYLKAKSVPNYEFFCFRASAYAARAQGLLDQAKMYAEKAHHLYPMDCSTKAIVKSFDISEESKGPSHAIQPDRESNHEINEAEKTMNTDASVFSFPKSTDPAATVALTERLHAANASSSIFATLADTLPQLKPSLTDLSASLNSFKKSQNELLQAYLTQPRHLKAQEEFGLHILQGWNFKGESAAAMVPYLLTENLRKTSGGYFIRWNGKGIVLNPGKSFLDHFHQAGLHIKDIDFVIVTSDQPEVYADIKQIYDLNYHLNRANSELQIIHYYLNQKAHQELVHLLKPNFKQERNTVHRLELFLDSPDVERIDLCESIALNYFPTSALDAVTQQLGQKNGCSSFSSTLGIKLELKHAEGKISFGYISGTAWSPLLSHHLGKCDLLLTGFGNTNPNDYAKESYNVDCLGYHGVFSLLEEVSPKLLLCSEFDGHDGDIRLEATKKMRNEYVDGQSTILPADSGLFINLQDMKILCSVTKEPLEPRNANVVRCSSAFGRLYYLAPSLSL